jgi:tetratricopeptide (TPR) repeat protein
MSTQHLKSALLWCCLLVFSYPLCALALDAMTNNDASELSYQRALQFNKTGHYEESASILKSLMISNPTIDRYRSDFIAVNSNAGLCKEVFEYANLLYLDAAPTYVKEAVLGCSDEKDSLKSAYALDPLKSTKRGKKVELQMIHLALETKNKNAALYWSELCLTDFPKELDVWRVRAQVLRAYGGEFQALLIYEDLATLLPRDRPLQHEIIVLLLDMGIPHLALQRIDQESPDVSPELKLRAMSNVGAIDVRWSDADPSNPPHRFEYADKSILALQAAQEYAKSINAPAEKMRSIEYDLIVAYERRGDWKRGIALYEDLLARGLDIPDYVKLSAAIELGGDHQYVRADEILQGLYQRHPDSPEILVNYYFNLIELDQFSEAQLILNERLNEAKSHSSEKNFSASNYTQILIGQALIQAYQDRNAQAFEMITQLLEDIPANNDALKAAGTISQWQGNYMQSEEYFAIALSQDPADINSKLGLANARMSQGNIEYFKQIVNQVKSDYSDLDDVQKAVRHLNQFEGPYITGNFGLGNGTTSAGSNSTSTGDLRGYSAPIDDAFRSFARYRGLYSGPAIQANVQGVGGGVQYTGINRSGEVEVGDMGYARVEGAQVLDDHWSVGASYEKNAFYLLPGALYANFAGNVAGTSLKWKNGETTESYIGYRYWTFADNYKQEAYGSITQRLLTEYNYKLDVSGWVGYQENTNPNVAYFAPASQTEYSGALSLKVLQWRDLETKTYDFWHRFYVSYGQVTQASYITLPMNSYGYGQDFNIGERKTLSWGIGRTSFPFNGVRSSYTTGYLNFEVHF